MEELLKIINGLEDGEVKSKLIDKVNREAQKVTALKDELKSKVKVIKELDSKLDNFNEFQTQFKDKFDVETLDELKEKMDSLASGEKVDVNELKALQKQLERKDKEFLKLQDELKIKDKLIDQKDKTLFDRDVTTALSSAIEKSGLKVFDNNLVINQLKANVQKNEDGLPILTDGELPYASFEDGVKELIGEKNPHWIMNTQGGSGAGGSGGGAMTISREKLNSMSKQEYAQVRDKIFNGEIKVN